MDDGPTWSITSLAEEFGVTLRTLRHYEDVGLITPERRGTTRVFHARDRIRLRLILRGKRLGFSLPEIRTIVNMYDEQPGEAGQLQYLLDQIDVRRAELRPAAPRHRRDAGRAGARRGPLPRGPGRPRRTLTGPHVGRGWIGRMRYAITGATGFVGGALARQLRGAGHEVRALVRDPRSPAALAGARRRAGARRPGRHRRARPALRGRGRAVPRRRLVQARPARPVGRRPGERRGHPHVLAAAQRAGVPRSSTRARWR